MKLNTKVPLLIGVVVLLTIISIIIPVEVMMSNSIKTTRIDKLQALAESVSTVTAVNLRAELSVLEEIATRARMREMNWDGVIKEMLRPDVARIGALELGIVYPDGRYRFTQEEPGSVLSLYDRDYVRTAFTGTSVVSDMLISRVTNSLVVMQAVAIRETENPRSRIVGTLVARRDASAALQQILAGVSNIPGSYPFMTNRQGVIVAHPDNDLAMNQVNIISEATTNPNFKSIAEIVSEALHNRNGSGSFSDNGKNYIVAYAEIPGFPWIFYLGLDESEIRSEVVIALLRLIKIGLVCLLIGLIIAYIVGHSIVKPITKVTNAVKDISDGEGNLSQHLNISTKDEIGDLSLYFNRLIERIRSPMCNVKIVINSLVAVAKELNFISESLSTGSKDTQDKSIQISNLTNNIVDNMSSVAASSEECSTSAHEVSNTASQMSDSMEAIALAIDEMTKSIGFIADNANECNRISDEATIKADNANSVMSKLELAANEIGQVTQTIKQIANKTNLLALNATVEAARAGDAGKGFAVVADEVKELANQSAQSADDIAQKISDIQQETINAAATIQGVSEIILKIHQSIDDIVDYTKKQVLASNEMAKNVSNANIGAKRVAISIDEVAKGSHLIAENCNEVSGNTDEVNHNMTILNQTAKNSSVGSDFAHDIASKLQDLSTELNENIKRFNIGCAKCKDKKCVESIKKLNTFLAKCSDWRNNK